jgi:hypothetical protein
MITYNETAFLWERNPRERITFLRKVKSKAFHYRSNNK